MQKDITVTQKDNQVVIQWATPMGDYDTMSIRQCGAQTDACTEHRVDAEQLTRLELRLEHGVEQVFTIVLYQEDQVVLESEPFKHMHEQGNCKRIPLFT